MACSGAHHASLAAPLLAPVGGVAPTHNPVVLWRARVLSQPTELPGEVGGAPLGVLSGDAAAARTPRR